MITPRTLTPVIVVVCAAMAACAPGIYSFTVGPGMIGQNDTSRIQWRAGGKVLPKRAGLSFSRDQGRRRERALILFNSIRLYLY